MRVIRRAAAAWRSAAVDEARIAGASDAELQTLTREFTPPLTLHEAHVRVGALALTENC